MAARTCPSCLTVMPAGHVVAYSNDLVCRGCQKPLEISALSRNLAIAAAVIASAGVWWSTSHASQAGSSLGWALPILYAVIALGAVAAILLMTMADLRIKDLEAASAATSLESHSPTVASRH